LQSVAVRLIVDREREINQFDAKSSYKIEAFFAASDINNRQVTFKAEGGQQTDHQSATAFLEKCINANYSVQDIQVKPAKKSPPAPFTTSTLQQEASRKLGYSVSKTMLIAQRLYENGHITYMRTDSLNLSDTAIQNIRSAVSERYGENYFQPRKFKNKNESAQEAHEAIRPTDMHITSVGDTDTQRLYDLIWKRTMACQMAEAQLERTIAKIGISTTDALLTATGEVLRFDGFLKVYSEGHDEEDGEEENEGMLPPLKVSQQLSLQEIRATERFTRPLPRYTEASLVKKLEELGIGRPSTYAPTISTIQQRGYVERKDKDGVKRDFQVVSLKNNQISKRTETENVGAERSKLFPTDLGMVVTDFLKEHFDRVMDYGFTARIEEEFDEIAEGKMAWNKMIDEFYHPFHERVALTLETAARAKGERELGVDPVSGKPVVARLGRFGPMVQIGAAEQEEKPKFATLKSTQSIETISLEEALDLFKLPLSLGTFEEKDVSVNLGRFGPYVKWGEQFISLPKNEDPLTVDMERALQLINEKQQADAPIAFYNGKPITKGKGRFGPFIKYENLYINVPRRFNFDALTQEDVNELVSQKIEKEENRYIKQWDEEKIAIERGRYGPFIRFGKHMLKIGKKDDGSKIEDEELAALSLDEVKKIITERIPDAFTKKARKKSATKNAATKKTAPKKTAAKKKS
jgi:DNA topoisomerase I